MKQYLFTIEHRDVLHVYPLNELISNLMPVQKSCHGGNEGLKKQDILKIFSWENI